MNSFYDAIYLSPHLDDAVLSCGGQIYQHTQAGETTLIVSIMAGDAPTADLSEFAQSLHDRWEVALDAVAVRREEDAAASDLLGADYLHLDLLDCIYRRDPDSGEALYATEEALFGDLHPAELALAQTLARTLANLPASGRVLAPLTAGHHVDHQLTRLAAEIWLRPERVLYYEEFPYVLAREAMPAGMTREDRWRSQTIELSDEALAMRIEATACYRSQLSTFFRNRDDLVRTVSGFVQNAGGERIWRQIAP
jgi:LmbE family N-acetylglucosaminyl deacetylase